jgi:hypothetical protein
VVAIYIEGIDALSPERQGHHLGFLARSKRHQNRIALLVAHHRSNRDPASLDAPLEAVTSSAATLADNFLCPPAISR